MASRGRRRCRAVRSTISATGGRCAAAGGRAAVTTGAGGGAAGARAPARDRAGASTSPAAKPHAGARSGPGHDVDADAAAHPAGCDVPASQVLSSEVASPTIQCVQVSQSKHHLGSVMTTSNEATCDHVPWMVALLAF